MKTWRKTVSIVSTLALLLNSLAAPLTVLAQETPSPEPTTTPVDSATPTDQPTIAPTETATPTVTPDATPAEVATPTPEITPTGTDLVTPMPSDQPIETQTPESSPTVQGPPTDNQMIQSTGTPTPTNTPVFTSTPEPEKNATVTTTVVNSDLFPSTVQDNSWIKLITDKLDYSPTEMAIISGSGFTPSETYSLTVASTDDPATTTTVDITADSSGNFTYNYQLDGNYRPNYSVDVKSGEVVVASTSFTDSDWPNCGFQCTANDTRVTSLTLVNASNQPITSCSAGQTVNATIRGVFTNTTNSDRQAAVILGDIYQGTTLIHHFVTGAVDGQCVADTLTKNTSTSVNLYSFQWVCGQVMTIQNLTLSWDTANNATCADFFSAPSCGNRTTKCYAGTSFNVAGPGTLIVHKTFTDSHTNTEITINITGPVSASAVTNINGDATFIPGTNGTYSATAVEPAGYYESGNTCTNVTISQGQTTTCTITDSPSTGTLNVIKDVVNDNGGTKVAGDFTIGVTGGTPSSFVGSTGTIVTVPADGSYSVSEGSHGGYSVSYAGDCSGTMPAGGNKTCTVTNNDQSGTLIVKKIVTNDNDGNKVASDFSFQVNGGGTTAFEADGQNDLTVNAGTYNVTEPSISGYATSYNNCSNLIVPNGGSATCTITNNDTAPQLIVIKHVVNDNGGNAVAGNFTMNVTGTNVSSASFAGNESGTTVTLNAGSYSVDEGAFAGYVKTIGSNCSGTIAVGETKSCTITNDDIAPTITLIKSVTNNNGGTAGVNDFGLTIGGTTVTSGQTLGVQSNTDIALNEAGKTGYSFVSMTGTNCPTSLGGTVNLLPGQNVTCTIANDDQPAHLVVIKHVITDNGGTATVSEFAMTINDVTATGGNTFAGSESGTNKTLTTVGLYNVTESGPSGYGASYSTDCTGTITLGETKTCTVTNDDIAPSLTLNKIVVNSNGANKTESQWTLTASGSTTISGPGAAGSADVVSGTTFSAGTYTLSESGPLGYIAGDWICSGNGNQSGDSITLSVGQSAVCTITNSSSASTIILNKLVNINWGGTAVPSNFTLTVDANGVTQGASTQVTANSTHSIGELTLPGYTFVSISGDDLCPNALNGTVTLSEGQNITCTITNRDLPAHLTVVKHVINDNGGDAKAEDFTMFVSATNVNEPSFDGTESGTTVTLNRGFYTVTENELSGYAASYSAGCSGTIDNDQTKTCTITNDDQAPTITLIKKVINDNGGLAGPNDFGISVAGNGVTSGSTTQVVANTPITINETGHAGYGFVSITGDEDCPRVLGGTTSLKPGQDITCTITNDDILGQIKIIKNTIGGDGTFDFTISGPTGSSPNITTTGNTSDTGFIAVNAGKYSASEDSQTGWDLTNSTCSSGTPSDFTVPNGETITCTFTNTKKPTLSIYKVCDPAGDTGKFNLQIDGINKTTDTICGGWTNGPIEVTIGSHTVGETGSSGTDLSSYSSVISGDCDSNGSVSLAAGENKSCTITNTKLGKIIVKKVTDQENTEDQFEFNSDFSDGNFFLSNGGEFESGFLTPGTYSVSELTSKDWNLTSATCDDQSPIDAISLQAGETITCTFNNSKLLPQISIAKSNNAGSGISAGSTVSYTLTLTNNGNIDFYNVLVTDFLPGGFTYVNGSSNGATFVNAIGPKLTWTLDSLGAQSSATITYQVTTDSGLSDGDYKNFARCSAFYGEGSSISCEQVDSTVKIGHGASYSGSLGGQVLGASTELPDTGSPTAILIIALGLLTAGFILKKYAKN